MSNLFTYLFDTEWAQRQDIEAAKLDLKDATDELDRLKAENRLLSARLDRAELIVEGLVRLLQERHDLDLVALKASMHDADLADGEQDGRVTDPHRTV